MLNFNSLLTSVGLDPVSTRLVRHKHERRYQRLLYQDAIRGEPRFEVYQSGQNNPRVVALIKSASLIAAFVVDPGGETVFAGLWLVTGCREGHIADPYRVIPLPPREGSVVFQLEAIRELSEYRGRLVVDWGGGERAWTQYANRHDKRIIELRRRAEEIPFTGFARFGCGLQEVDGLPTSWSAPLQSARGVYLLVHTPSGAQYVGAATGADGFLGRWRCYADGHGGNIGLRELAHAADQYDVWILETVGSKATSEDVFTLESLWKEKLGSRAKGLNRN